MTARIGIDSAITVNELYARLPPREREAFAVEVKREADESWKRASDDALLHEKRAERCLIGAAVPAVIVCGAIIAAGPGAPALAALAKFGSLFYGTYAMLAATAAMKARQWMAHGRMDEAHNFDGAASRFRASAKVMASLTDYGIAAKDERGLVAEPGHLPASLEAAKGALNRFADRVGVSLEGGAAEVVARLDDALAKSAAVPMHPASAPASGAGLGL